MDNKNVVIISGGYSYLVDSMKNNLTGKGYIVSDFVAGDELPEFPDSIAGIVLYASDKIVENLQLLVYIKDTISESACDFFVIADKTEEKAITGTIPKESFSILFERPVNTQDASEKIDATLRRVGMKVKKKILAIDDSPMMLRSISDWLSNDYQVTLASSGMAAIKQMAHVKPDLILLDYEMPVANGRQILEMIRSDEELGKTPVVFLTSHNKTSDMIDVMKLNVQGYILKTNTAGEILNQIRKVLE